MARREQVVELGDHRYTVVPQRIGRLKHELGDVLALLAGEGDTESIVDQLGGQAHAVLAVFIDELMPKHEFLGYASEEALGEDRYDKRDDRSPDFDQIVEAYGAVMKVNRLDLFKHLEKLVGADFFQAAARKLIADALTGEDEDSTPRPSQSSSSAATPPTTSTPSLTVVPTEDQPGGGYEMVMDDPGAGHDSPENLAANGG